MPSATTPLAPAGKAAEGAPRVRRPAARRDTGPLAEGGFVFRLSLVAALAAALLAPGAQAAIPHRIVSLSPTATEDLFAIGAGKQVVAVDSQSDYPKRAPHTRLSAFTPNAEAVIGYQPDLVVIAYDPNGLAKALGKAHIHVLVQASAHSLADAYA